MNFSLCKRVVIKIGSNILTDEAGKLDLNNMRRLVEQISELHAQGIQVTMVSSGAIVCGSERIGRNGDSMPRKQAAAAIGQSLLMNEYSRFFAPPGNRCRPAPPHPRHRGKGRAHEQCPEHPVHPPGARGYSDY